MESHNPLPETPIYNMEMNTIKTNLKRGLRAVINTGDAQSLLAICRVTSSRM